MILLPPSVAQKPLPAAPGGTLPYEEAVYDVKSYDVSLAVDPAKRSIQGTTVMTATVTIPTNAIRLDLDSPYTVASVTDGAGHALTFERTDYTIRVHFPLTKQPGETIKTSIAYSGVPRVARRAPWDGGFVWSKTADGSPWVAVALEGEGVDLLFPAKDDPSDRPDSAAMHVTVPDPLVAVGPGKLQRVVKHGDGTSTYDWWMSQPITNYSIVFDAAPYRLLKDRVKSVGGQTIPIDFYVLPEDAAKGPQLIAETKKYLAYYEEYLGPYAFRSQKLGIVETPHLGMEHSTAIAYGNHFRFDKDGMDWLMLHEFGHEWWANLVTMASERDMWLHEGFQSFMDSFYQETIHDQAAYRASMAARRPRLLNRQPVAPREGLYGLHSWNDAANTLESDQDIYDKGALVLHALRYLIGDPAFFRALRHMAYPDPAMEKVTDGRQQRFATTDDFLTIAEQDSGRKLGWFFEVYLRQPKLPKLVTEVAGGRLDLRWETPDGLPFPMPIDVSFDGKIQRIEMPNGRASVPFTGAVPVVDPNGWVLRG